MNQSKKITDGALLAAVFIVLLLIAVFVPVVSLIASVLLPIPFIMYAYRYNWKPSILLFVVVLILTTLFATYLSIPLVVAPALGGIMIGTAMHNHASPFETWARGTVGFIIGFLFAYVFAQVLLQINFMQEFEEMVQQSLEQSKALFEQFNIGAKSDDQLKLLEEQMLLITKLFPMMLVTASIFISFLSQWIGYKIVNRVEKQDFKFPPFRTLRFPVSVVWIYFFALIISFFDMNQNGFVFLGVQNIMAIIGILIAIQGVSFVFFFAHEKRLSKAIPIIVTFFLILLSPILIPFVRILGIIDIGFPLRERMQAKK